MMRTFAFLVLTSAFVLSACAPSAQCHGVSRQEAIEIAKDRKQDMLHRSRESERTNFTGAAVRFAKISAETNGYAANVAFKGRDGRTLIALIDDDCRVGWTYQ